MHPDALNIELEFNKQYEKWLTVAKAMSSMLELWPGSKELFGDLDRVTRARIPKTLSPGYLHDCRWNGRRWQCIACAHTFSRPPGSISLCAKLTPSLLALGAPWDRPGKPHRLWVSRCLETGLGLIFCKRCGAYCSGTPRKLLSPCSKVFTAQKRTLEGGRLPWPKGYHISKPWPLKTGAAEWWGQLPTPPAC